MQTNQTIMRPYDANIVTDYVIMSLNGDERFSLINLKLQKLVYYIQAWALGIEGTPMMDAKFEAWVHGPVCRPLYERFKTSKSLYSFIGKDDVNDSSAAGKIADEDKDFINYILENYACYSGTQLESMTHKEQPWIEARNGAAPMEHCENEISELSMKLYYGKKYEELPA